MMLLLRVVAEASYRDRQVLWSVSDHGDEDGQAEHFLLVRNGPAILIRPLPPDQIAARFAEHAGLKLGADGSLHVPDGIRLRVWDRRIFRGPTPEEWRRIGGALKDPDERDGALSA